MMHGGFGFFGLLIAAVAVVVPLWRICDRLGFPAWISLGALVPLANVVLLYFLAFAEWPIDKGTNPQRGPLRL
jgi:hypothetical protein